MITFSSLLPATVRQQLSYLDPQTPFWELISSLQGVFSSPVILTPTQSSNSLPFSRGEFKLQAIHEQELALQGDKQAYKHLQRLQKIDTHVMTFFQKDDFSKNNVYKLSDIFE